MSAQRSPAHDERAPTHSVRPLTRERYLDVGADLAAIDVGSEPAYAHVAAHVKLTDVARRLGTSRSSLYRRWGTQHDYWSDLVSFMLTRPRPSRRAPSEGPAGDLRPGDLDGLLERVRVQMAEVQDALVLDPRRILRTSLLGYPPHPLHAEAMAAFELSERSAGAERLGRLLDASARTVLAPLTTHDLVAAIWMFIDGIAHHTALEPQVGEVRIDLDGRPWSLSGYAARCVIATLTVPAGESRPPATTPRAVDGTGVAPTPRWSSAQVEALETGAEIFVERLRAQTPAEHKEQVLGHITLARVARAADVSRRQIYHLWSSQEAFRRDLLALLREREALTYRSRFDASLADALDTPDTSRVALDVCERINRQRLAAPADPMPLSRLAFEAHLDDPLVRADARASFESVTRFHRERIAAFVAVHDAPLTDGVTVDHVNHLFTASAHGSLTLHRLDPAAIRTDLPYRGRRCSMYSIAVQAVVDHSLQPSADAMP